MNSAWTHSSEGRVTSDFRHRSPTGDSVGREEAAAEVDPGGAEQHDGRDAAPVPDAARGDDGDRCHRIDHLRYQAQRADAAAVPAGLPALGHEDVGAVLGGHLGLLHGVDLLHHQAAGIVHLSHAVTGVVQREGHDGRCRLERGGEGIRVQGWHHVVDREGRVGEVLELGEIAAQLVDGAVPGPEAAKGAGVRDRRGQLRGGEDAHPRLDDRELDADEVAQG